MIESLVNFLISSLSSFIYILPALLISITLHELAHGYTAYWLGDPTAKNHGRLTFNPIKHIDPIGFLTLLILKFGWAKPVPYNPNNFKNRKIGTLLVAVAGPLTNILLALIALFLLILFENSIIRQIIEYVFIYNLFFAVFNLIPIPPLDGSKIIASLLPVKLETYFWKYEKYGYVILLILIFTNIINYVLNPLIQVTMYWLLSIVGLFLS